MDADAKFVEQARAGDAAGFEELVKRHQRRVYRVLMGITGNTAEAEDAAQTVFLKAYLNLGGFKEEARFSTWLTRIAINEGLQRLRRREKNVDSLDDPGPEGEEDFRPRQVQAWDDNPEQRYSKTEVRELLEREIMKLPAKYRVVVVMRDLEEASTAETAEALDLTQEAVKTRLLRGRLMLREALAPVFRRQRPASAEASTEAPGEVRDA